MNNLLRKVHWIIISYDNDNDRLSITYANFLNVFIKDIIIVLQSYFVFRDFYYYRNFYLLK